MLLGVLKKLRFRLQLRHHEDSCGYEPFPPMDTCVKQAGIEAVHWSSVGDLRAPDHLIMDFAREHGYIVFTHDLDFGTILAATQAEAPSVIQIRTQNITPVVYAAQLSHFYSGVKRI